jgi:hypothetical protein
MSTSITPDSRTEGLRERHVVPTISEESSSGLSSGQDTPQNEQDEEKEKKTFGRTPDGTSEYLPHYTIYHSSQHGSPSYKIAELPQFSRSLGLMTWFPS